MLYSWKHLSDQSELPRIDLSSPKNYAIEPPSLDLVSHLLNVARVSISFFAAVSAGGQRVPAARMWGEVVVVQQRHPDLIVLLFAVLPVVLGSAQLESLLDTVAPARSNLEGGRVQNVDPIIQESLVDLEQQRFHLGCELVLHQPMGAHPVFGILRPALARLIQLGVLPRVPRRNARRSCRA